jgi:hypothetical protein
MKMKEIWKYVMVIVREGSRYKMTTSGIDKREKEKFNFLTLYDPRSATEYQCGVKPNCPLYQKLYFHKIAGCTRPVFEPKEMLASLADAADKQLLLLGPAITPRLELQVYNHKDEKVKELLGQCQVSISSVLSGSGAGDKSWVTLIHKQEKLTEDSAGESSKIIDINAGEVQLELAFRRSIEIEAEQQAEREHALKSKVSGSSVDADLMKAVNQGGDQAFKEVTEEALNKHLKKSGNDQSARVKELEEKYGNLLIEYRKLKSLNQSVVPETSSKATTEVAKADLLKEREAALAQAEKAQREKAAMEKELKKANEELAKASVAPKVTSVASDDIADKKLLQELAELRKQNELLKAAEVEAKQQIKALLNRQAPPSSATAPTIGSAKNGVPPVENIAVPAPAVSTVTPKPALTEKAANETKLSATPSERPIDIKPKGLGAPSNDGYIILARGNLSEATQQLLQCLLSRSIKKNKGNADIQPAIVLDGFNHLLNSYANIEGLISHKDLVHACAELLIDMDTETAVRLVQQVGPNQRKLVQVYALMDLLTRELTQLMKGWSRANCRSQQDHV